VTFLLLSAHVCADAETALRRIQSHLLIHDLSSAYQEAAEGARRYPASKELREKEIEVLAAIGDEKGMLKRWRSYNLDFPDAADQTYLLEAMGWGVINKGFATASPLTRAIALIAANLSQSAKGIDLLVQGTHDPNAVVRAIALELGMQNRDARLQERVLAMMDEDRSYHVRLAALKAAGGMKIKKAEGALRKVLQSSKATDEEVGIAVQSLALISENPSRRDILKLVGSNRMGLRLLGCELAVVFDMKDDLDLLVPLLSDASPAIRQAALQVVGISRVSRIKGRAVSEIVAPLIHDPTPEVAIMASWVLMLNEDPRGHQTLRKFLEHENQEIRCVAAGCLKAGGRFASPLIEQVFYTTGDPYVKINAAIGLIGQRKCCREASEVIFHSLSTRDERWMWQEQGIFKAVAPSRVRHRPDIPQFPEVANQLVRLELLQLLAFLNFPKTELALKDFLMKKTFGITGVVVALMLTEGEEESIDLIRPLLHDPDPNIQAQAALILAIWGREEGVIKHLEHVYEHSDRSVKERVLEGMGRVGSSHSLPFLVERLSEPHQHLRMIAAAGIIQCVNH